MDIYSLIRRITSVRSPRLRLAMLWAAHAARRRTIGVFIDPVVACNLRCRMCAFSDAAQRKRLTGRMDDEAISRAARALFHRALKVQIGCGAEPTIDPRMPRIIALAKEYKVPYVSVTTNGQLLSPSLLADCIAAGLDEVTLSLHGTDRDTYEWFMPGADFTRLESLVVTLRNAKKDRPALKVRVNYTVNADNVESLAGIFSLFGGDVIDILQIRPVQNLGDTSYHNFDLGPVRQAYDRVLGAVARKAAALGVTCIMPGLQELDMVAAPRSCFEKTFEEITYCYVGPQSCYADGFDACTDTYESFHRRRRTSRTLLRSLFSLRPDTDVGNNRTKKLNYTVRK